MVWVRILVPVQLLKNEQNFDLFPGVLQGVAGKDDLAHLDSAAAVDGDRADRYFANHGDRMDHGSGVEHFAAFHLFFIWEIVI